MCDVALGSEGALSGYIGYLPTHLSQQRFTHSISMPRGVGGSPPDHTSPTGGSPPLGKIQFL